MSTPSIDPFARYEPGEEIGVSRWVRITQPFIDQFGELTLDPDPMHINPEWARRNGPFGGTISFGFQTISLLTVFLHDAMGTSADQHEGRSGYFLNYGFDRLRLVAPVPVDSRVRGHFTLLERRLKKNRRQVSCLRVVMEIEGSSSPALVGDWLAMWAKSPALQAAD